MIERKKDKIIFIALVTIILCFICIIFYYIHYMNKLKHYSSNDLKNKIENKIYFNTWFYIIQQKNAMGQFLQLKDFEFGYLMEDNTEYKINDNVVVKLKDIRIVFNYLEKNKTLSIYVDIYDKLTGKNIFYSDISKAVLRKICDDIITLFYQNLLMPIKEKKIDITIDYINYIEFNFNPKPVENGYLIGIVKYKRNNLSKIFDFDFLDEFEIEECIFNCKK